MCCVFLCEEGDERKMDWFETKKVFKVLGGGIHLPIHRKLLREKLRLLGLECTSNNGLSCTFQPIGLSKD